MRADVAGAAPGAGGARALDARLGIARAVQGGVGALAVGQLPDRVDRIVRGRIER